VDEEARGWGSRLNHQWCPKCRSFHIEVERDGPDDEWRPVAHQRSCEEFHREAAELAAKMPGLRRRL
jgi:hypothetical protein